MDIAFDPNNMEVAGALFVRMSTSRPQLSPELVPRDSIIYNAVAQNHDDQNR